MRALAGVEHFPAADKSSYLNAASVALMQRDAIDALIAWQRDLAEYGTIRFDEAAEVRVFEDLHRAFAELVGARPDDVAVGSSATELLASLAWAVAPGRGTNIVSAGVTFPSTVYPWARVARHTGAEVRLVPGRDAYADPDDLIGRIDGDTAVVTVSHVEYGSGQRYDLERLARAAHDHGALLVVDATQSAGAVPIDAPGAGVDALVTAAYKWLCGPFGVAVMYLAPHLQTTLDPGLVGFRSHRDMWDLNADRVEYADDARRFEFSTMAYGCAVGLTEAIRFLLGVGIETIFAHNRKLANRLIAGLEEAGARILSPLGEAERTSIVSARFPGKESRAIVDHLAAEGIVVSSRRDFVRFSPHLYNGAEDIERALAALARALRC